MYFDLCVCAPVAGPEEVLGGCTWNAFNCTDKNRYGVIHSTSIDIMSRCVDPRVAINAARTSVILSILTKRMIPRTLVYSMDRCVESRWILTQYLLDNHRTLPGTGKASILLTDLQTSILHTNVGPAPTPLCPERPSVCAEVVGCFVLGQSQRSG